MKTILLLTLALLAIHPFLSAQHAKIAVDPTIASSTHRQVQAAQSAQATAQLAEVIIPGQNRRPWDRQLETFRLPDQTLPLDDSMEAALWQQKEADLAHPDLLGTGPIENVDNELLPANPIVQTSFNATALGSTAPMDNSMAISNGGYIVTAINSKIAIYNSNGALSHSASLYDFFNGQSANQPNHFYDPKVLYDSGADRFIVVCLVSTTPSTSKVMVAFSSSSNPTQAWYKYFLAGNVLNNNCWLDYPQVGISSEEVYVTGNLYTVNGTFNQALIYQIPKAAGFAGQQINWQYWHGISGQPFSICPLSWGGQGNYGAGCYLVAHSLTNNSKTLLYDLTDYISASNEQLLLYNVNVPVFQQAASAAQKGTSKRLDSGDPRIQSGFYQDGIAHYVFSARLSTSAWSAVHYHRIDVNSLALTTRQIGSSGWDYAWPSVAWFGTGTNDKSVLINMLYSNSTVYPSTAVSVVDNANVMSPNVIVYGSGVSPNLQSANPARWGDYTAAARRKSTTSSPRVWVAGNFGQSSSTSERIAQIKPGSSLQDDHAVREQPGEPVADHLFAPATPWQVFPNPLPADADRFQVEFSLPRKDRVRVDIFGTDGRYAHTLFEDAVRAGHSRLSFRIQALDPGTYVVRVQAGEQPPRALMLVVLPR